MDIIWKEQGFIYKGEYRELNEHTLLLDGSLSREEAAWHPHASQIKDRSGKYL